MAKKKIIKENSELEHENVNQEVILDIEVPDEDYTEQEQGNEDGALDSEDLAEKIKGLEGSLLRSRAELDNIFKRNIVDIEKAHKYGVERLLNELLPVVDNLEHAINNFSEKSSKEDKEGVALTLKSFESALDKFGIRPIYPLNEMFDPIKHEAVMTSQDPEKQNNEIESIFQRGWEIHERVVRPARVSVIKN